MIVLLDRAERMVESFKRKLGGFAGDKSGIAAVEFAMLLPLMLSLWLGAVELSQGIAADRKVTLTARTISDLVSQVTSTSTSDIANSLNAATAVMAPFPTGNLKATVSSVVIDANSKATIGWSCTYNGAARSKGSGVTLPAALLVPNTSLIWSEVQYAYTPTIGYIVTGTLTLKDQIYMRPRLSDTVAGPSSC
jgi:Flp pilus assembly protein TadG